VNSPFDKYTTIWIQNIKNLSKRFIIFLNIIKCILLYYLSNNEILNKNDNYYRDKKHNNNITHKL